MRDSQRRRVAVVTGDTLGRKLSGPGIRALELSKVLATDHDVRLVSTVSADLDVPDVEVSASTTEDAVRRLVAWCDVLVFQGFLLARYPWVGESDRTIVVDLYDPFHLEQFEQRRELPRAEGNRLLLDNIRVVNEQLARGDYFICASEKQRDFWLGELTAVGRVNAYTYYSDQSLRSLIDVVPFGLSGGVPAHTRRVLRGVVDGIGPDDHILLWGGGLYPWFDPHILLRAVDRLRSDLSDLRLVFLAGRHPNPDVPPMATTDEARALAAELGLGDHVFFVDQWVEYGERHNYLLEADIGVSTHLDHLETQFSFRTRILDYIWAGLPIVTTGGDAMGELVHREQLGRVVPAADVEALASALGSLLHDADGRTACRARLSEVAALFQWPQVAAPLAEFCRRPGRAPDLQHGAGHSLVATEHSIEPSAGVWRGARLFRRSVRDDGWVITGKRVASRVRAILPVPRS